MIGFSNGFFRCGFTYPGASVEIQKSIVRCMRNKAHVSLSFTAVTEWKNTRIRTGLFLKNDIKPNFLQSYAYLEENTLKYLKPLKFQKHLATNLNTSYFEILAFKVEIFKFPFVFHKILYFGESKSFGLDTNALSGLIYTSGVKMKFQQQTCLLLHIIFTNFNHVKAFK